MRQRPHAPSLDTEVFMFRSPCRGERRSGGVAFFVEATPVLETGR